MFLSVAAIDNLTISCIQTLCTHFCCALACCLTLNAVVVCRSLPLPPSGDGLPFIGDTFSYIKHGPRVPSIPNHARLGDIYRSAPRTQLCPRRTLIPYEPVQLRFQTSLLSQDLVHGRASHPCWRRGLCEVFAECYD